MTTKNKLQQEKNSRSGVRARSARRDIAAPKTPPALVDHVLATLPDSLARRGEILQALADCIPPGNETALLVRAMQFHLEEHEKINREWVREPEEMTRE